MAFAQKLVGLNQADDRQDRDEAQRRGIDGAGGQLPVDQQGQDRKTQNDIENDHLYHPSAYGPIEHRSAAPCRQHPFHGTTAHPNPDTPRQARLYQPWHKHATPMNICMQ